jgi:hypothetical protein
VARESDEKYNGPCGISPGRSAPDLVRVLDVSEVALQTRDHQGAIEDYLGGLHGLAKGKHVHAQPVIEVEFRRMHNNKFPEQFGAL